METDQGSAVIGPPFVVSRGLQILDIIIISIIITITIIIITLNRKGLRLSEQVKYAARMENRRQPF